MIKTEYSTGLRFDNIKEDINHYAKISKVEVIELKQPNDEIAAICKKPFLVTVLSY